ncbi:MAG: hypothetical protein ABSG99_07510 [Sedimentisphaerales bacterium]
MKTRNQVRSLALRGIVPPRKPVTTVTAKAIVPPDKTVKSPEN